MNQPLSTALKEHDCDVIVSRWQEYTGEVALREGDGAQFDEAERVG